MLDTVAGFGPLQPFLDDPSIEEIWINDPGRVFVARRGRSELTTLILTADELAVHLGESPVLVLACLDTLKLGPIADANGTILSPQSAYASIFPAVQNLMLAARGLGLGSTLTTLHFAGETEIRALLGIPSHIHIAALIPLGYPLSPFRPTKRKPIGQVLHYDRWRPGD